MSENLADQVVRPSYEQIAGSIKHSGVREILRRAQEGTLEVSYQTGLAQIGVASGAGQARGGKGYRARELHQG